MRCNDVLIVAHFTKSTRSTRCHHSHLILLPSCQTQRLPLCSHSIRPFPPIKPFLVGPQHALPLLLGPFVLRQAAPKEVPVGVRHALRQGCIENLIMLYNN